MNTKQYELTAANLRTAANLEDDDPITADNLIAEDVVWEYCVEHIDDYLALIETDEHTASSCTAPEALTNVINAEHEEWTPEQMEAFLGASAESATLTDITAVDHATWKMVVEAFRMIPNITNLHAYVTETGVDNALSELITDDAESVLEIDGLENANAQDLEILMPTLLNADDTLTARKRVLLAKQLLAAPESPNLDLSEIEPQPDALLAELLREELVPDSEEVFTHFSGAGWPSIELALELSTNASTFLAPSLVAGNAADLLRNSRIPVSTRQEVLRRLTEFSASEDSEFLAVAASAARTLDVRLSTEALTMIAPNVQDYEDVVWQLREQEAIAPTKALRILGRMPGEFVGFAEPAGHKFEVPDTPSLGTTVDRLKAARVLALQPGRKPAGRLKLRIV